MCSSDLTSVEAEIELADWPASSMVSIVFFCAGERDHMMIVVGKKEVCSGNTLRYD